jgi:hypothetical protein
LPAPRDPWRRALSGVSPSSREAHSFEDGLAKDAGVATDVTDVGGQERTRPSDRAPSIFPPDEWRFSLRQQFEVVAQLAPLPLESELHRALEVQATDSFAADEQGLNTAGRAAAASRFTFATSICALSSSATTTKLSSTSVSW